MVKTGRNGRRIGCACQALGQAAARACPGQPRRTSGSICPIAGGVGQDFVGRGMPAAPAPRPAARVRLTSQIGEWQVPGQRHRPQCASIGHLAAVDGTCADRSIGRKTGPAWDPVPKMIRRPLAVHIQKTDIYSLSYIGVCSKLKARSNLSPCNFEIKIRRMRYIP